MGFKFEPSIWFVCRICRQAFRYLYKLKEHKVQCHLGECLKTKCIIFEERSLDHEWIPSTEELRSNDSPFSYVAKNSNRRNSYRNPYVSLQQLSSQEVDISPKQISGSSKTNPREIVGRETTGIKRTADQSLLVSLPAMVDDEPCTEKKFIDVKHVEITVPSTVQEIVFDAEVPKIELKFEELYQLARVSSPASNLVCASNTVDTVCEDSQVIEIEDRKFIVANTVQSLDGSGNIQFVSTTSPQLTLPKITENVHSISETNFHFPIARASSNESAADVELPHESQVYSQTASNVVQFEKKEPVIQAKNLFRTDENSAFELPLSEESVAPTQTTSLNQSKNNEDAVCGDHFYLNRDNSESNTSHVTKLRPRSKVQSQLTQELPTVTLTLEELSLRLLDWLTMEKANNPSNVIRLDPNPFIETGVVDASIIHPMKCVLCKLELTSDPQVKEHVRMCWDFNKAKHLYCVPCKKSFAYSHGLKRHCSTVHKSFVTSTASSRIGEAASVTETEAEDINLIQEASKTGPETNSDSCNNNVLENRLPASYQPPGSRYNIRRNKSKVNYSETQACKGCRKDFLTVEDVERHEKLCPQLRPESNRTNNKEAVDDEIQVIRSTTKKTSTKEIISDDENYESSDNSESDRGTDIEMDDNDNGWQPKAPGRPKKSKLPAVRLTQGDLSLPLVDWLAQEKESDPSNVILLDPNPATQVTPVDVHPLHPIKCALCKLELTSDTQVKEHVKICWNFNKARHLYCVRCKKSFTHIHGYKGHCIRTHNNNLHKPSTTSSRMAEAAKAIGAKVEDIIVASDEENYESSDSSKSGTNKKTSLSPSVKLTQEDLSLPLLDWLTQEKAKDPSNVILLDPDVTNESVTVAPGVSVSNPITCVLCSLKLTSETAVKKHVRKCWRLNKVKHVYCPPCKRSFSSRDTLRHHRKENHRLLDWFARRSCTTVFIVPRKYDEPLKEWLVLQKQEKHPNGSSNVILIDPDPTLGDLDSRDIAIDYDHPVTCLLCQMLLFGDPEVRNHVENCWWHNKDKHRRCVPCKYTFDTPKLLQEHQKYDHVQTPSEREPNTPNEESDGSDVDRVDSNNDVISLKQWLKIQKGKPGNVVLLNPDPSNAPTPLTITTKSSIKCVLCGFKLVSEFTVRRHVRMCWRHNKENHTYCVPCEKAFSDTSSLNEHNCNEHFPGPEFPFNCTVCYAGFKDGDTERKHRESLIEFVTSIEQGKYNPDNHAAATNSNPPELPLGEWLQKQKKANPSNYILLEPDPLSIDGNFAGVSDVNPVTCRFCFRKFTAESVLRTHVEICWTHNKKIHRHCAPCDKTFSSSFHLKTHRKQHPSDSQTTYECNVCGKKYVTLFLCKVHQESHTDPEKLKPFRCQVCGKCFALRKGLAHHMLSHSSHRQFKCPHCPAEFKFYSALYHHLKIHDQDKHTANKCRFCGRFFPVKVNLIKHERIHTGDRPFKCHVAGCSKAFPRNFLRFKHFKKEHGDEPGLTQYLCPSCGKTFPLQYQLNYHIQRSHTEAKDQPFKCPHEGCTKRFGMKFLIAPHMLIHTGEKAFQCDRCGRAFATNQALKLHQLTHNDERAGNTVRCKLCPKTFRGDGALKRHLKVHEKRQKKNSGSKFECQVCGQSYSTKSSLNKHEKTHETDSENESEEVEAETEENTEESGSSESEYSDVEKEQIQKQSL